LRQGRGQFAGHWGLRDAGNGRPEISNAGPSAPAVSEKLTASSCDHLAAAVHDDLAYAAGKVAALLKIDDPDHFKAEAEKLAKAWDQITGNTLLAPSAADALARIAGTSFANGLQRPRSEMANNGPTDEPRDKEGKWSAQEELRKGHAAMDRVIRLKRDETPGVYRPGIGHIDFLWGKPGQPPDFEGGHGVSKIIEKRNYEAVTDPELAGQTGTHVAHAMVEATVLGKIGQPYANGSRLDVEHKNLRAVLTKTPSRANHWLLTGFIKKEKAR
jgi:hypothetical protein